MEIIESASEPEESAAAPCHPLIAATCESLATAPRQPLTAAAASPEVNNLFTVLSDAELVHHDALIEVRRDQSPHRAQFKLLQGGACLCRTSPGKA